MVIYRYRLDGNVNQARFPDEKSAVEMARRDYVAWDMRRFKFIEIVDGHSREALVTQTSFHESHARHLIPGERQIRCEICGIAALTHVSTTRSEPTRHYCEAHAPVVDWWPKKSGATPSSRDGTLEKPSATANARVTPKPAAQSPSFRVATFIMLLAGFIAALGGEFWRGRAPEKFDICQLGTWALAATPDGVAVKHRNRDQFTVYPGMMVLVPAFIAGAIFLRDDIRERRLRLRGFSVRYPRQVPIR